MTRLALFACLLICWSLAAAFALSAGAAPANYQVKGPEMKNGLATYVITSDYQEKPCPLWVLLPDKFDKTGRYKVLYILPALGPGDNVGVLEAKKLGLANKHNIICVGPDFSRMPWYADSDMIPHFRYDSYLPDVVVPFIDKTYPTIAKPEGRILVGFSKSGLGSVSLLVRHADVFGRAGAWDAALTSDNRPEFYCSDAYFKANYYLPHLLTEKAAIFAGKPARIAIAGRGFGSTARAHKQMQELNIPHYCDETLVRDHSWSSGWLAPLVEILMSDDMTRAKPVLAPASEPK